MKKETGKKICIIRSNPVKPDSRVEKEAWSLAKAGYDIHILAWDRDTDVDETEGFVNVANMDIPITWLGHKASYGEGLKNLWSYLAFQVHMRKWLMRHDFDVIHACDFDTAFFSRSVVKRKKERFVFDIFDFLYSEPCNFMQRCVKRAQLHLVNYSDATIICTEERKEQIKGSNPKRLIVIHNTPFETQASNETFFKKSNDKVYIAYVGVLQDYRLLKETAEVISGLNNVEFHVGGFGKYDTYFSNMSKKFSNIKFYGRLPYNQTLALEKNCDIMLAIYDPTIANHKLAAPNKFYESLMLGKPVIMVKDTGMSRIIETNNIGVLIEYSKSGLLAGINQLIAQKHCWKEMGERMMHLYSDQYNWNIMEGKLLNLYRDIFD